MLIVKIKRDQDASQPRWHWNSDLWKSTNVLNEDQANDTPGDYKNRAYSQMPFSKIRFVLGPKLTGGLVEDSLGGEQSSQVGVQAIKVQPQQFHQPGGTVFRRQPVE